MNEKESRATINSKPSSYNRSFRTNEDDLVDTMITIPPDGGWGWVVVLASFLCNFVADGAIYTFGIFLKDISKSYDVLPTTIAVGNSLMTGFYYILGPVTCALVNVWGFQLTGFLGGAIASVAFILSSEIKSIYGFLFVFGVVGGFGFGMVYVPSVVVIGFYFEKWRALATSIAVTGSAAGIIGFPLIVEGLLADCKWQNKFKVIGGGCLLASFLALIYRPLKPVRALTRDKKVVKFLGEEPTDSIGSFHVEKKPGIFKRMFERFHNITYPTAAELQENSAFLVTLPDSSSSTSVLINNVPEASASTVMKFSSSKVDGRSDRLDKLSTVYEDEDVQASKCRKYCTSFFSKCVLCKIPHKNRPMYRDDIFYTGSLYTIPNYSRSKMSQLPSKTQNVEYHMSVTRVATGRDNEVHCKCCPESVMRTLVTMLNFSLLSSPSFLLLAVSGFFSLLGMYIPFIYIIQRADQDGISRDISYYFYTALGTSNAIGRITSGIISTFPQTKPLIVSSISISICGISTILSYFCRDVYSQFIYISIFGFTIACLASLRAPILVDMLGLENLTNAFGILLLFQGVAAFIGMPLAGQIVKATSYNDCFIFSGCTITLSAILLIPIKYISNWEKRKSEEKEIEEAEEKRRIKQRKLSLENK